jgi:hypothetical protein
MNFWKSSTKVILPDTKDSILAETYLICKFRKH